MHKIDSASLAVLYSYTALNKAIIILTIALLQGIDISMVSYDGILYASLGPEQLGIATTEVAEVGKFTL